jgi:hypothetical protein
MWNEPINTGSQVAMFVKYVNVKDLTASWSNYIFNLDNTVNGTGRSIQ